MRNSDQKVAGVRVLDIAEEGAKTIETMFNKLIADINQEEVPIVDVRVTDNHCFLLLGKKNSNT